MHLLPQSLFRPIGVSALELARLLVVIQQRCDLKVIVPQLVGNILFVAPWTPADPASAYVAHALNHGRIHIQVILGAAAVTVNPSNTALHQFVPVDIDHEHQVNGALCGTHGGFDLVSLTRVGGIPHENEPGVEFLIGENLLQHRITDLIRHPARRNCAPGHPPEIIFSFCRCGEPLSNIFEINYRYPIFIGYFLGNRGFSRAGRPQQNYSHLISPESI